MKLYLGVLIAAVTVNCLVTTINATKATDTLKIPYTDMLLPPLEEVEDNSKDVVKQSLNIKTTTVSITSTSTTTTTTKKPTTNNVNNISPELSIEALLPPLFEAKIEKEGENINKQETTKKNKIYTTTTTQNPTTIITTTTTTTRRPRTTKPTTTIKPSTKTSTLKPLKAEVPLPFLDALLPPIFDNTVDNIENTQNIPQSPTTTSTTTTPTTISHKPVIDTAILKTTKKSYYQQQTQHLKELHLIDQDETHSKNYATQQQQLQNLQTKNTETENYNKQKQPKEERLQNTSTANIDKQVAESKAHSQQVVIPSQQHFHKTIEKLTLQHVAEQKKFNHNDPKNYKYSFDFYLGTTTARPPKSGLPTITPFPHRLGR